MLQMRPMHEILCKYKCIPNKRLSGRRPGHIKEYRLYDN